jgi:hypothetical protein
VSTSSRHFEQTGNRPGPQISEARRQTVETARQSWIRKLIDLSRRNNLLYFRALKTGTLELSSAPSETLRDLLVGESEDDLLAKTLLDISRRALENSEDPKDCRLQSQRVRSLQSRFPWGHRNSWIQACCRLLPPSCCDVSLAVEHMSCAGVHDLHERVIRCVLKVIATSARLRQTIELRSRNRIRCARYQRARHRRDRWLPGPVKGPLRGKELYIGGIVRTHNFDR